MVAFIITKGWTMTPTELNRVHVTTVPCGYCDAAPGEDCTTPSGESSADWHEARKVARSAYAVGLRRGREQMRVAMLLGAEELEQDWTSKD